MSSSFSSFIVLTVSLVYKLTEEFTLKNEILNFSIRHQSYFFIFQISSFITQILLNIFQNYNLTKLVNSLHIVLSACVKLCYMTSFFCHVTVFFHIYILVCVRLNKFWIMINQTLNHLPGWHGSHGWLEGENQLNF